MKISPIAPAELQPDFLVFNEIAIIHQLTEARLEKRLPRGMTSAQFGVLNHFYRRGGAETPAHLASAFQVSKGTMTNTLQRLEAAGLIKVEAHAADGRKKLISLTPEGASVHNSAVLAMQPDLESMREAFTDAEFAATLPFLRSLRAWLDENR